MLSIAIITGVELIGRVILVGLAIYGLILRDKNMRLCWRATLSPPIN